MKILIYFTIAVLDPSRKTLTTGVQRSDFIAKLTKDYRLDLSTQHMKDLTKASLVHEKMIPGSLEMRTRVCILFANS